MRAEEFSGALQFLEDGLLAETDSLRGAAKQKKKGWMKLAAAVACLAAAVYGGVKLFPHSAPGGGVAPPLGGVDLPMLTISEDSAGYGFEGYMAYDVSELVNGDPWEGEAAPETLPVFRNTCQADPAGMVLADPAALEARAEEIAQRLGLSGFTITESAEDLAVGEAEGATIRAYGNQRDQVEFDPARPLPLELKFTYHDSSCADMEAVGEYLKGEYAEFLDMAEPVVNVTGGDYNIYGQQSYNLCFYDGAGSAAERMAARDLKSMWFCCNAEGELWLLWLDCYDLSQKAGDYPVITAEEAEELLVQGHYATSVPCELPGREYIAKVELMYRSSPMDQYFIPYYRFYVELPEMKTKNGLNTYGAYYVPAVEGKYLTNMPTYDGRFN